MLIKTRVKTKKNESQTSLTNFKPWKKLSHNINIQAGDNISISRNWFKHAEDLKFRHDEQNEICGAMVLAVLYTVIAQHTFNVTLPASVWLARSRVSILGACLNSMRTRLAKLS